MHWRFCSFEDGDHPLVQDAPSQLSVPHSRWNEVREEDLISNGYDVLTKSATAGVDLFVKQQRKSLFVYFQGHLEYEAQSLLGEYRRDIGRFLRQEIGYYPTMPTGYFDDEVAELLIAFQGRALLDGGTQRSPIFQLIGPQRIWNERGFQRPLTFIAIGYCICLQESFAAANRRTVLSVEHIRVNGATLTPHPFSKCVKFLRI